MVKEYRYEVDYCKIKLKLTKPFHVMQNKIEWSKTKLTETSRQGQRRLPYRAVSIERVLVITQVIIRIPRTHGIADI